MARRFLSFAILLFVCGPVAGQESAPPPPEGKTWKLVWHDEFDGDKLDETKWVYRPDGPRKGGWWNKKAVSIDGEGHLVIRTYLDGNKPTDGCVTTQGKFEHAFGYYVARVKFQKQPGHWSAFWINGTGIGKVGEGGRDGTEIDIMEKPWLDNRVQHTFHWDGYGKDHKSEGKVVEIPGVMEGWHTFGLLWTQDEYVFYVDGKETWRSKAGGVCQVPQYMLLSDEIGPWAGDISKAKLPDEFLVDNVRVYDLNTNREDLSLREFLLNDLFKTYARPGEICYVAFGSHADEENKQWHYDDPPDQFLKRFDGRTFTVKPASSYARPTWTPERNPKTDVPDGLYEVEIVEWINSNMAKVKVSMYRRPLWAAGHEATVQKKDGKWQVIRTGSQWIS